MNKKFDRRMAKGLSRLPLETNKKDLWGSISNELDFDDKLQMGVKKLPQYNTQLQFEDLNLSDTKKTKTILFPKQLKIIIGTAAAILILFTISTLVNQKENTTITIHEMVVVIDTPIEEKNNKTESIDPSILIEQYCQTNIDKCNSEEIIVKRNDLKEIESRLKKVDQIIKDYGDSPSLVKTKIRIENMRSDIIKEIFKLLDS